MMNFLSALFTAIAIVVFADCLRMLKVQAFIAWAVILSLIPIVFISGTYTIDYNWALAFILLSWNLFIRDKLILCGAFLGLAIGCRVTSGAVLFGYIFILYSLDKSSLKPILILGISTLLVGIICYLPSIYSYGLTFFDTYRLPYPSIPKVIVKGSIGVWGFTGIIALIFITIKLLLKQTSSLNTPEFKGAFLIILLYTIAFIVLPQKSSFFIPAIPFVIYLASTVKFKNTEFAIIGLMFFISPFTFGLNLNDSNRGSSFSNLALTANVYGQEVFFDPLKGPVQIEQERRINRQKYIESTLLPYQNLPANSALLCGWWMNQFVENVYQSKENSNVILVEFANAKQLDSLQSLGFSMYHLVEIDRINDERYTMTKTREVSIELK